MNNLDFIKNNYRTMSKIKMAQNLGICGHTVKKIMKIHNLEPSKEEWKDIMHTCHLKCESKERVKTETFRIIDTPQKAYCLGLIWADGHINSKSVRVNCLKTDLSQVLEVFYDTGNWSYKEYTRPESPNIMLMLNTSNMRLAKRFMELNYHIKSGASAKTVLAQIPENLQRFWWRGYFDGDGCINFSYKCRSKTLFLCGCFEQEWNFAKELFYKLGESPKISKETTKKHSRSSRIAIRSMKGIYSFFNYIYGNDLLRFGFKRKYNKFVELFKFKQTVTNKHNNFLKEKEFEYWI